MIVALLFPFVTLFSAKITAMDGHYYIDIFIIINTVSPIFYLTQAENSCESAALLFVFHRQQTVITVYLVSITIIAPLYLWSLFKVLNIFK